MTAQGIRSTARASVSDRITPLCDASDAAVFGPKAATLAMLAAAGERVPDGVCVPADIYREHAARAGVSDIAPPPGADDDGTTAALARVRSALSATPLDPDLVATLSAECDALGGGPFAVRSSGTAEDLPGNSFAGQHGTYFVASTAEVPGFVERCWGSLWSDHAHSYRVRTRIADPAMAVIVQRLVPADAAGVAFTVDPVTSFADRVIVESCYGIGDALVSGKVAPDRFSLEKSGPSVVERRVGSKALRIDVDETGAVHERTVDDLAATRASIDDECAVRVAELALRCEHLLGAPADVEWALAGGAVHLLQARPITTVLAEPPLVWSNANTGEILPDVVTPMNWSIVRGLAAGMIESAFGMLGVDLSSHEVVRLIAGRAYFNVTVLGAAFKRIPTMGGGMRFNEVLGGLQGSEEIPVRLVDRPVEGVDASPLKVLVHVPSFLWWLVRHTSTRAGRFVTRTRQSTDEALARLESAHGDEATAAGVLDDLAAGLEGLTDSIAFGALSMGALSSLQALTRKWLGDEDGSVAIGLLAGRGDLASAQAGVDIWKLGRQAAATPDLAAVVEAAEDYEAFRATLQKDGSDEAATFLAAWDAFMSEHGHHCRGELEVANPRWVETPDYVLSVVRGYAASDPGRDPLAEAERRAAAATASLAECRTRLRNPFKRALFTRTVRNARLGSATRENVKNEGVRRIAAIRWTLLVLGEALVARGVLRCAEDAFYVTMSELPLVRAGTAPFPVTETIAARRADGERNARVTPPPVIVGDWRPELGVPLSTLGGDSAHLTGFGVSPGVATGPARVIASVTAHERVLPGEILVAPFTDPGWTPYFMPAAGIVMDMGGLLSHGSIIAREFGIPAVVNVGSATTVIRTGDIVTVDGSAGVVTLEQR